LSTLVLGGPPCVLGWMLRLRLLPLAGSAGAGSGRVRSGIVTCLGTLCACQGGEEANSQQNSKPSRAHVRPPHVLACNMKMCTCVVWRVLTLRAQMRVARRLGAGWILVPLMLVACALSAAMLPQGTAAQQLLPGENTKPAALQRPELAGQDYSAGAANEALQRDDLTDDFLALLDAGGINASAPHRHGIPPMTNCTAVQW